MTAGLNYESFLSRGNFFSRKPYGAISANVVSVKTVVFAIGVNLSDKLAVNVTFRIAVSNRIGQIVAD